MSDFVSALREELVGAAEREQARRAPRFSRPAPRLALGLVAAAVMVVILALAAGALSTRTTDDESRPAEPTPEATRDLFGGGLVPEVRYRTRAFIPALSFVVPDDQWYVGDSASPLHVILDRRPKVRPGQFARFPGWLAFDRINEVVEPTAQGRAALIPAPTELYEWFRAHPDLRVGRSVPTTVAGVPAERFHVEVRFDRPAHGDVNCRRMFLRTCTLIAPEMSFFNGVVLDMYLVATEPQPLLVTVGGNTERGQATVAKAAGPVLETLRIGVR